jgi:hypothetical protein
MEAAVDEELARRPGEWNPAVFASEFPIAFQKAGKSPFNLKLDITVTAAVYLYGDR